MNLLRNFFSGFITFLLVPLILIYLVITSVFGVLLNSNTFHSTIAKNSTYQRLAAEIIPPLLINTVSDQNNSVSLPSEALTIIIAKVDKNTLASDLEKVVKDTYNFVTSKQQSFETKINLLPYTTAIKDNLKSNLISHYNSLPNCSSVLEEQKLQAAEFSADLNCKYKGFDSAKFVQSLKVDNTIDELGRFPTTLIITEKNISTYPQTNLFDGNNLKSKTQTNETTLIKIQKSIQIYKNSEALLLVVIAFLILLLILSRFKNLASMSRWVSSAFFSASFLPLIGSSLLLYFVKPNFFKDVLMKAFGFSDSNSLQKNSLSLVSDNLFSFSQKILQDLQFKSLVVIVIAIVLYGIYLYLTHLQNNKPNKPLDAVNISTHNIS